MSRCLDVQFLDMASTVREAQTFDFAALHVASKDLKPNRVMRIVFNAVAADAFAQEAETGQLKRQPGVKSA